MSAAGMLNEAQLQELEGHLLDTAAHLSAGQLTDEERILVAAHRLGPSAQLGAEFEHVTPWTTWRAPIFWSTVGVAWVLGVEAVLDVGVPLGALVVAFLNLPLAWLRTWAFVVCVGGPAIAFASVAAWMRHYSATNPRSKKALFVTVAVAAMLRGGSVPLLNRLQPVVSRGLPRSEWSSFETTWQAALLVGFLLVSVVGALAMVRFSRRAATEQPVARSTR